METLRQATIIKKLYSEELSLFTISNFKKLFGIKKDNTAYKIIERLTKKAILKRLTKKRYLFTLLPSDDFQLANFLYSPSYISLESALSFYGIIAQFPYQITSITSKKTKAFRIGKKEFAYSHIKESLFLGYEQKEKFLIALPEKALFDYLYLCSKGLRLFEKDAFDLKKTDKKIFLDFVKRVKNRQLTNFLTKTKL
jgi:predicted transcriptional regulator of viral defense system